MQGPINCLLAVSLLSRSVISNWLYSFLQLGVAGLTPRKKVVMCCAPDTSYHAKELPSRNFVLHKSMDETVYSVLLQHTFQTLLSGMHCQI